MRGKGFVLAWILDCRRITPAHAGKSYACHKITTLYRDHPRACGEKGGLSAPAMASSGSPPRMRGKGAVVRRAAGRSGITPAHAGKSLQYSSQNSLARDHPRACGEKNFFAISKHLHEGSPPRMRGKVRTSPGEGGGIGITPAHAGKSIGKNVTEASTEDHPRACGEKSSALSTTTSFRGSPPRMRGKVHLFFRERCGNGITPARAGKRIFSF